MQKDLPERQGKKDKSKQHPPIHIAQTQVHIGPIPDPKTLEDYGKIDPSFPERIVRMAEREQMFRHRSYYIGQFSAIIIVIAGLASAVYLGVNGKEWLGGTIGLGALASIVGAYFYSHKFRKKGEKIT